MADDLRRLMIFGIGLTFPRDILNYERLFLILEGNFYCSEAGVVVMTWCAISEITKFNFSVRQKIKVSLTFFIFYFLYRGGREAQQRRKHRTDKKSPNPSLDCGLQQQGW